MMIAILGWGSLIWECRPEFDDYHEEWQFDGPNLKLEFSRISQSRSNALTLVLDSTNGYPCQVGYTFSKRREPADTICDLRTREGTTIKNVGYYFTQDNREQSHHPHTLDEVKRWVSERNIGLEDKIDIVIWTDLLSNFAEKSRERNHFSIEAALSHIQSLDSEGKSKAAEYIWRTPEFVDTPLRRELQSHPWFSNYKLHQSEVKDRNVTQLNDETVKKVVKTFCERVFWLKNVHNAYKVLFENEFTQILMERTAQSYFMDLNMILINYLLLSFAKITDPAATHKNAQNLTVDNIIESIAWPPDIKENLNSLKGKTQEFRCHIKKARNKLLAHADKKTILTGDTLGEFPNGEDDVFIKTLEDICNIIHDACFGEILGNMNLYMPGDVFALRKALLKAVAFDELLSESPSAEKARILSYLDKVEQLLTSGGDEPNKGDSF